MEFTSFYVYVCGGIDTCSCDHVKITDGDGTTLMDKSCGISSTDPSDQSYFMPPILTSRSNRVDIFFHTDDTLVSTGWSVSWAAVTPGLKALTYSLLSIYIVINLPQSEIKICSGHPATDHSFLSECSLASPGSLCTNLESENCKYEGIGAEDCCCGQCPGPAWLNLVCVQNSTTGEQLWQPVDSLCPAEVCGTEGEWWS